MSTDVAAKQDSVTLTIDGIEVTVPKGTLAIRAAERLGIAIPRFCDHPLLDPMGACRQCMVEVPDAGNGRGFPKPQASCTLEVADGMQIKTQLSSPVAAKAQSGMLEFLLINHPLDCPICDKGGECPLQNQAMSNGRGESRYEGVKRTFPKPVAISAQVLLDRERCVLCARCTRFSEQISGDPFIALVERGALQQVGFYEDDPYDSYFSGNVIQICPVGALTSADYRFQSRPFDLVSTQSCCEHCASGCALRVDHRHFQVKRRLAGADPEVNEEWNCDKGRFGFYYGRQDDRVTRPLVREGDRLVPASWPEAIDVAVRGLTTAMAGASRRDDADEPGAAQPSATEAPTSTAPSVGVLTGGRLTLEASYAYSRFARSVLGTNNIDFRSRPHTKEEGDFLAHAVAGRELGDGVTYTDLDAAKHVVLVGFEPEDESPIVFLRLRHGVRKNKLTVHTLAPFLSKGSEKLSARLIETVPGTEADVLANLERDDPPMTAETVVLVGERAALAHGTLTTCARLAEQGAKVAWIPRRAGDRGAIEAGCLPHLLPGGRLVSDAAARVDVAAAWGVDALPTQPGLDADAMVAAAGAGELQGLLVAGIEPGDFRNPQAVLDGLENAAFVVCVEQRLSEAAKRADVVFPAALLEETSGTFLDWEHRQRSVAMVNKATSATMTDLRILAALADAFGADLGMRTPAQARADLGELGVWEGERAPLPEDSTDPYAAGGDGEIVLATWRQLIDDSRGNDGSTALLATARPAVARLSPATAERLGVSESVSVGTEHGSITLPLQVTEPMCDDVVWIPTNTAGQAVYETLGVVAGDHVHVGAAAAAMEREGDVA